MKLKYYIIGILTLLNLTSCYDFLDRYPQDAMNDKSFFTNEKDLEYYMNSLYNTHLIRDISSYLRWQNIGIADDDIISNNPSPASALMQHSNSGVASENNDNWKNSYEYLNKVNYFIENAKRVPNLTNIGKHYYGEGFYCRAFKYFNMLRSFGGVPYINKPLGTTSPELYTPRSSREVLVEKIIADLDSAVYYLHWKGTGEAKPGRINKDAALVLMTRVGLYEGSWEYYHGLKNSKFQASNPKTDIFLNKAVEAGNMLIEKHGNNLFKGSENNEYFEYFNQKEYENVAGAFLYKSYSRANSVIQKWMRSYAEGAGGITRSAVDAYLMKDGKPSQISSISYDPKLMNSLADNKDPRLSQTIWSPNKGRFFDFYPTVVGGYRTSYPGLIKNQQSYPCHSGYRIWKGSSFDADEFDNGECDDLIIRYEEGLLNFAEAKAILGELTQTDLDNSINYIRARVGMPNMVLSDINGWDVEYTTQNGFDPSAPNIINEIRRERRVELILEGFRLDDIKRWALLEEVFNGVKPQGAHAQEFLDYWNDAEKVLADGFKWKTPEEVTLTLGKDFDVLDGWINPFFQNSDFKPTSGRGYYLDGNRDYLTSIPRSEIILYKDKAGIDLVQNPGWY